MGVLSLAECYAYIHFVQGFMSIFVPVIKPLESDSTIITDRFGVATIRNPAENIGYIGIISL
jgi:hypothetical protein